MENMYPVRTPREILKSKTCEFFKENNFKLCCTMARGDDQTHN